MVQLMVSKKGKIMTNNQVEEQLRKLMAGEIPTAVDFGTDEEDLFEPAPFQPSSIGDTSGSVTANAAENEIVQKQQQDLIQFRQASQSRVMGEQIAKQNLESKLRQQNEKNEAFRVEAELLIKQVKGEEIVGQHALKQMEMQYLPAPPLEQLPAGQVDLDRSAVLREYAAQAYHARVDLDRYIDEYAQWWLVRFVRFLLFSAGMVVAIWLLYRISRALLSFITDFYAGIRQSLLGIEPPWLQQGLWILILLVSVIAVFGAIYGLFRFFNHRFFDTQDKRSETKLRMNKGRSELVHLVFDTNDNTVTKHMLGRMWVMSLFAIRRKMDK